MSHHKTVTGVISRIKAADIESPIAVYTTMFNGEFNFECRFASTIATKVDVKNNHPNIVGIYSKADVTPILTEHLLQIKRDMSKGEKEDKQAA